MNISFKKILCQFAHSLWNLIVFVGRKFTTDPVKLNSISGLFYKKSISYISRDIAGYRLCTNSIFIFYCVDTSSYSRNSEIGVYLKLRNANIISFQAILHCSFCENELQCIFPYFISCVLSERTTLYWK